MPTGREALDSIIDAEAAFAQQNGRPPKLMKLPLSMAYDLAKCRHNDLGDLSGRILENGIEVLGREGFRGMKVEIIGDKGATLQFE